MLRNIVSLVYLVCTQQSPHQRNPIQGATQMYLQDLTVGDSCMCDPRDFNNWKAPRELARFRELNWITLESAHSELRERHLLPCLMVAPYP